MSKSKMHKYEVGKSRPTENRASNAMSNEEATKWVAKIDEASKVEGVQSQIQSVANVIIQLAEEIKVGRVEIDVLREVIRRRNVKASLQLAYNKLRYLPIFQNG
jgi:peptidoglycan hydrolase CwlO-like protein